MVLQAHYRSELNFSWENLEAAQNRLNDLRAWADLRHQSSTDKMPPELDELWRDTLEGIRVEIMNDMNTPGALARLAQLVNYMEQHPVPSTDGEYTKGALAWVDSVFGLNLDNRPDITSDQKQLLSARAEARANKNFDASDKIRKTLEAQGINVRDTDRGQIWARI